MHDVLAALTEQQAELDSLVNPVDDISWTKPSRCDGWSVSDVVLHLAQTNEMALASIEGRFVESLAAFVEGVAVSGNVDDGAGALVDKERGEPPVVVYSRWRAGVDQLMHAFSLVDPHARVQWVAGTLSAHTLCTTRLAETWIHTNDVAHGLGATLSPAARIEHIARLAWRTLPYAFERSGRRLRGPVTFELTAPDGHSHWVFASGPAKTIVRGPAVELCEVAGQRAKASDTSLTAEGPDAADVLELVRTFA